MAGLKLGKSGGSALENLSLPGKIVVGLVFALLVGAAYFVIFYGDVESDIAAQKTRVDRLKQDLSAAEEAEKAFNKDLTEKKRREQLVRKQKKILPDEAESPAFLSTIQNVATLSGVQLTSWTPQDQVLEDFYAKVPMELTVSGKFHQVAKFFYGIGQVDRIINMENIIINTEPRKKTGATAKGPRGAVVEVLDTSIDVSVECLSTAFRALSSNEQKAKSAPKGKKGKKGKPKSKGGAKK